MYDFLIVGAGFFGSTIAERLATKGRKVLIIDKRRHIGGNSYSHINPETGIEVHTYGSHIFHTSNEEVWNYITGFSSFNDYRHTVWTTYQDRVFSMPINLNTINAFYGLNLKPSQVQDLIKKEIQKESFDTPTNLEEKAVSLIGRPLYEAFIKGYTIKQWDKDPTDLPPDIITRLPVRSNYNNRYFRDKYEGIPVDGYGKLFERMLDHPNITIQLNTNYFKLTEQQRNTPTVYTGPIDLFFNFKHGHLDWRTIDFETSILNTPDYQGCTVMNYADPDKPYTRIHEFKHYHPERPQTDNTIIYKEFSRIANQNDDPYYPVNTPRNMKLLKAYYQEVLSIKNVRFGGRLGEYRYLDMDKTIERALELVNNILKKHD